MTSTTERSRWPEGPTATAIVAGLAVLALVLRALRLGDWNFEATEIFTLKDSLVLRLSNPRPLSYALNYYLVRPFMPLDELGLRILPALFGVLTIPAFYLVGRRMVGTRAALFGSLLLCLSELHVFYSQFARYWSLVILLCAIYPFALYLGVTQRERGALMLGLVTGALAALAHPVSVLLVGGPALLVLWSLLRPGAFRALWAHRGFRWGVLLAAVLAVLIVVRFLPVLQNWITAHDTNPGSGQFLNLPKANGLKQVIFLGAFAESLTFGVALGALAGLIVLWQDRDRTLARFLLSLALFPIAFITLVSFRTAVSQFYLVPALPVFFLLAGVFLDRLFSVDWKVRPWWLIPATLTAIMLTEGLPTLVSQYRNGRRFDFRGAAHWLETHAAPTDLVFSDQPMVLQHYLPNARIEKLRTAPPLAQAMKQLRLADRGVLWIVAPAPAHAFRTDLKQGGLAAWMWDNCQLRNTVGVGRIDFRQQYLQVYRCPPAAPGKRAAEQEAGGLR